MPSIDTLTAAIRAALDRARHLMAGIGASRESAAEVHGQLARIGTEGSAAQMAATTDRLEEGHAQAALIAERLEAALAAAEAARTGAGGGGGGAPPGPPPTPAAGGEPFKPMRTDRKKADELRPYVGQPIAYATLYDEHGRKLVGIHNAGDDGPARDANWREPWASMPRLRRHVEAHAAARMTRDQHRQLAMYINLPPCSYQDGCKLNVADLLPKGTTLWVHQTQANGMVRVHRFGGTGKAIRDDH